MVDQTNDAEKMSQAEWRGQISANIKTLFNKTAKLEKDMDTHRTSQDAKHTRLLWAFITGQGAVLVVLLAVFFNP